MPFLEVTGLRRAGYGFGLRQPGLRIDVRGAGSPAGLRGERWRTLTRDVRSSLGRTSNALLPSSTDSVSLTDLAEWALSLQRRARIPVFERALLLHHLPRKDEHASTILLPYVDMDAASLAIRWAFKLVNDADGAESIEQFNEIVGGLSQRIDVAVAKLAAFTPPGVNSYRICEAAFEERIPFSFLSREVLLLGQGTRLKRMLSTITDTASPIGVTIARSKTLTARTLRQAGFPTVSHAAANSEDHAVELAENGGYPTVVKPADADGGAGVFAGLMSEDGVRKAYREALKVSKQIIVEQLVPGHSYRIHVCNGRIVKATLRRPGGVDGDGVSNIRDLVQRQQTGPQARRRQEERGKVLLQLDDEAREMLGEMGMSELSVPDAGHFVPLRRRSNVSTGGTTQDIQGTIHPDTEAMLVRAAELLGLDFAGIDFISPDISRSWLETPAVICEINAQPQLGNDLNPKLYHQLLCEYLGGTGRIPWALVLGDASNSQQTRRLGTYMRSHMENRSAPAVLAASGGVWAGSSCIAAKGGTLAMACDSVAMGRYAAAAVIAADAQAVLESGLPSGELEFLALASNSPVPLPNLEACLDMVLPCLRRAVLLEVGDPALPMVKSRVSGPAVVLVSPGPLDDVLNEHLAGGGWAAWVEGSDQAGEGRVIVDTGVRRVDIGVIKGTGGDRRLIRDLIMARVVEVQLPLPAGAKRAERGE